MAVLGHAFRTTASRCFVFNFLHVPSHGELTIKNRVLNLCFFSNIFRKFHYGKSSNPVEGLLFRDFRI